MSTTLAPFGEVITTPDRDRQFVMRFCGDEQPRPLYCATCLYQAPTRAALSEHCKREGEHLIVGWCRKHGMYETLPPKQEAAA